MISSLEKATFTTDDDNLITREGVKNIVFEEVRKVEEKFERDRSSILTIFGIFATILIFVSLEFQIIGQATSLKQLASLSLLAAAGLMGFVVSLQWITKTWIEGNNSQALWALVIIIGGLLFAGGYLAI